MQKIQRFSAVLCLVTVFSVNAFAGNLGFPAPPPPPATTQGQPIPGDAGFPVSSPASTQNADIVLQNSIEANTFRQALTNYVPILARMMDMFF
ncbi:MAG: hypothetical protein NVSMB56_02370 [Pyrinomonadaceae bacterium]